MFIKKKFKFFDGWKNHKPQTVGLTVYLQVMTVITQRKEKSPVLIVSHFPAGGLVLGHGEN